MYIVTIVQDVSVLVDVVGVLLLRVLGVGNIKEFGGSFG